MKAITLTQPWATLVALGEKKIETRSWRTHYRGPLAIHAAKTFGRGGEKDIRSMFERFPQFERVLGHHGWGLKELPRSAVVATCQLVSIVSTAQLEIQTYHEWTGPDGRLYRFDLTENEYTFGDYSVGRYAWLLADIKRLGVSQSASGRLGLWEWTP